MSQLAPHLLSPAHLAQAAWGERFETPPHIAWINRRLRDLTVEGVAAREIYNLPYQHGKSWLISKAFPAWRLLYDPNTRITLIGHGEEFAASEFGAVVKDLVNRFGPAHGIKLREDTKAKGNWKVEGYEGGMYCTGPGGGAVGRPADLFVIDDLIRTPDQAVSPTVLDNHWSFYETTVKGRLRNQTSLFIVGTRWSRNDLCGRILRDAQVTGEKWNLVRFKALAEKDDPLGRQEGEALWPENVSRAHLEGIRKTNRWWRSCWQQDPEDETGQWFRPREWPTFGTLQNAWSLAEGPRRLVFGRYDATVFAAVDWAFSERSRADFTAIGVFACLPGKRLLVLDVVNERIPPERWASRLEEVCRKWGPQFVIAESSGVQGTMMKECRERSGIPPLKPVGHGNQTKLQRSVEAIILGDEGRVYTPTEEEAPWLPSFREQLSSFNGMTDEHDDMVDILSYAARQVGWLTPGSSAGEPEVLVPGRIGGFNF